MKENRMDLEGETALAAARDAENGHDEAVAEAEISAEPDIARVEGEDNGEGAENYPETETFRREREEYDALIKTRFKNFYAEDTQKMINRRFRKYRVLEERYKTLEEILAQKEAELSESKQKIANFDGHLRAELEKAVKETEERVLGEIRAKKARPAENGISPRRGQASLDVSKLTKDQRAVLARRAATGERIKL